MTLIQFTMLWSAIIRKGEKHPQGGYVYQGLRTMVTSSNNRKIYDSNTRISYVEIGKKIRIYGVDK